MKWRNPTNGERRTVRKFACIPRKLDDGMTVWLEFYFVRQEYRNSRQSGNGWVWLRTSVDKS